MIKKLTTILFIVLLVFAFAACGGSEESATDDIAVGQFDSYVGGELTDLMAAVEDSEYTATYYNQGEDWTNILPLDETWANDFLVGSITEDAENKTIEVDLALKANVENDEMEASLQEKLEVGYAWIAAEKYGKELYGDGFELNYYVDKIAEYAEDENTWFLKAGGELAGQDVTCEATVTGTTESPEVLTLDVY